MNAIAYYSDGMKNEFRQEIKGVNWTEPYKGSGRSIEHQDSECTLDLIESLLPQVNKPNWTPYHFVIDCVNTPKGTIKISDYPFYIYGEHTVSVIVVNGVVAYSRYGNHNPLTMNIVQSSKLIDVK